MVASSLQSQCCPSVAIWYAVLAGRLPWVFICIAAKSFIEQISMRTRAGKLQLVVLDAVQQQPIRIDMKVAGPSPITRRRVIVVEGRKRLRPDQEQQGRP